SSLLLWDAFAGIRAELSSGAAGSAVINLQNYQPSFLWLGNDWKKPHLVCGSSGPGENDQLSKYSCFSANTVLTNEISSLLLWDAFAGIRAELSSGAAGSAVINLQNYQPSFLWLGNDWKASGLCFIHKYLRIPDSDLDVDLGWKAV
ncbi:hypothetical protein MG293_010934, partial [Ovis ammon polii]